MAKNLRHFVKYEAAIARTVNNVGLNSTQNHENYHKTQLWLISIVFVTFRVYKSSETHEHSQSCTCLCILYLQSSFYVHCVPKIITAKIYPVTIVSS